ncbi:Gfo/Idh/MocA family oxidoreductase [Gemmobacter sp. 24YEA27]|uniref:Gfo/Idh/MocA family protein n=1 Tax=Gemmobacter sp. 24YEA27 TaxID=3040672 RepID=UPI0024B3B1AE|nr:Gfo/Idh/MocA family oxidoreductase [Gemmobacter sp. 24YEA27]
MSDVKIAQIGCGYWGKNLARNFAEIGALGAIVDDHPATATAISAQHGVPARTLDEVLADPEIHGLSFATPAETHAGLAARALAAGKHVYVEKPMALTAAECRQMIAAAEQADRVLMVGHLLQYHPIFVALRERVHSGDLGELRYIYSNRLSLGKFRVEEDVLWSFAPHDISMILALANRPVAQVSAQAAAFVSPGIADMATCQIGFGDGLRAHVFTSWSHPFKEQRLVVVGSTGMAVFEDSQPDWDRKLALYRHRIDTSGPVPIPESVPAEYVAVPKGEPLKDECREFVAAIAQGRAARTDGAEGLAVIDVLERASQAIKAGH